VKYLIFSLLMSLSQFACSEELPLKAQYKASVNFLRCGFSGESCTFIFQIPETTIDRPLTQGTGNYPYDYQGFDGPIIDEKQYIHADVTTYVAYDVNENKYDISAILQVRNYEYSAPYLKYNFGMIKVPSMGDLNETTLSTYFEYEGITYKTELNLQRL